MLVFLLLFLRQLLMVLLLLRVQLVLLLLVFLVCLRVSRVRSRRTLVRLKVLGVVRNRRTRNVVRRTTRRLTTPFSSIRRTWNIVFRSTSLLVAAFICRRMVWRSCLSGRHRSPALQFSWSGCGCDRWPALINRSPLLRVIASRFLVLSLSSYGRYVLLTFKRLLLRRRTSR